MKNKITALALVAVTAFSLAPKPAKAGDKELAVVGGLIGGLIIGSAIADANHSSGYYHNDTVVVDHRGGYDNRYDRRNDDCYDRYDSRYDRRDRYDYGRGPRYDSRYDRRNDRYDDLKT